MKADDCHGGDCEIERKAGRTSKDIDMFGEDGRLRILFMEQIRL